ncbi:MAG TPA: hypothetical protein VE596_00210 [Gaiellaceae bacterium]|nr:hypothetical protein [Gaiellaceae bacterium]
MLALARHRMLASIAAEHDATVTLIHRQETISLLGSRSCGTSTSTRRRRREVPATGLARRS